MDIKDYDFTKGTAELARLERLLGEVQQQLSHVRLTQAAAIEGNRQLSFDSNVKARIADEAMGNTFARVLEARTHISVAIKAMSTIQEKL